MPLKTFLFTLILFADALFGLVGLPAEELAVHFKTTPASEMLRPFTDPTDLSLLVTGADGRPVKQGTVGVRLEAPLPGRFFPPIIRWWKERS